MHLQIVKEKIMKELLSTGEFAKLCQVNKKTLFHYDKIGILKPYAITNQGYRYYALHQLDTMNTIKMFQRLGMSLKDMQHFISSNDLFFKQQLHQQIEIVQKTTSQKNNYIKPQGTYACIYQLHFPN